MGDSTIISWTDHTANFWMGCQRVSEGCRHCYAERLTHDRMGLHLWGPPSSAPRQIVRSVHAHLAKWDREVQRGVPGVAGVGRHLVFVGSLMDWAEDAPGLDAVRAEMWQAIRRYPTLHFQLLTKRAHRIAELLPSDWWDWTEGYPNVWLGVSVEDMRVADRVDALRRLPAVVRFVSYEPALGPLDALPLAGLDWVIVGGESGPGYRPMDLAWARRMRDRCRSEGVAFFFKQSSGYRTELGTTLDGRLERQFPRVRPSVRSRVPTARS